MQDKDNSITRFPAEIPGWIAHVLEIFGEEGEKNDVDALGMDGAPEWVLMAWVEACKIMFPGGLPEPKKWDAYFFGLLLGRLRGLESYHAGEIGFDPETEAELENLLKRLEQDKNPQISQQRLKEILVDLETRYDATRNAITTATSKANEQPHQERADFHAGLAKGMDIKSEDLASSATLQRHTRTYFVLAKHWRWWVQCKSLREVHGYLCKAMGEQQVGDFKTFEKVCKKIGFRLRGRGRPKGK